MSGASPGAARTPKLRTLVVLLMSAALLYVVVISWYLSMRVGRAASELTVEAEPVLQLYTQLTERASRLNEAVARTDALAALQVMDAERLRAIRDAVQRDASPAQARPFAHIPVRLRIELARIDDAASRLQNSLEEVLALLQLGRVPEARARLAAARVENGALVRALARAQRLALEDLNDRQRRLDATVQSAVRTVALWFGLGLALLPVGLWVVRRRLGVPLAELETGLTRVAEGDLTHVVPVRHDDELGQLAAHFNATTRILRARAEEAGRLAAAGELVAGVAHEVNNPLMAISAISEGHLADAALPLEQREEWERVRRQARRAGTLLSGLLRFVRPTAPRVESVAVNAVLRSALELVAYRFPVDEITLQARLAASEPRVRVDAARLEQVFVNLLSNAIDAMTQVRPPRRLDVQSWAADGVVHVAVDDSGPGIPAAVAERLFHPFMTTKGATGTGLGLYISRQIVRDAGGELVLDQERPADATPTGARFVVRLPAAVAVADIAVADGAASAPAAEPAAEPAAPAAPGAEPARPLAGVRVLVVDDEEVVRAPVVKFLVRRGALVQQAGDGLEALERLSREPADVILADLRMPRMSGAELLARLRATDPGLAARVVLLTGDITQLDVQAGAARPARVLLKPVELREVEAAVLAVVGRGRKSGEE